MKTWAKKKKTSGRQCFFFFFSKRLSYLFFWIVGFRRKKSEDKTEDNLSPSFPLINFFEIIFFFRNMWMKNILFFIIISKKKIWIVSQTVFNFSKLSSNFFLPKPNIFFNFKIVFFFKYIAATVDFLRYLKNPWQRNNPLEKLSCETPSWKPLE